MIRTSGEQSERVERLKVAEPVPAAPPSPAGNTALDQGTQNALLRFARFVRDDQKRRRKTKATPRAEKAALPETYLFQIDLHGREHDLGSSLDIYV